MRHLFRNLTFFALGSIFVISGFGCKAPSAADQAATRQVTLEYWTVFDDVDALQKQIEVFHAAHPYVTVNLRQLSQNELYPRLVEALAEDRGPDIVSVSNRSLAGWRNKLAPLPETVNDTTISVVKTAVGTNQTVVTTVPKRLVTANQLDRDYVQAVKNDVLLDGQIYGLPLSFDTLALYYNKDLLDRAGVPETPKSWEQFQAAIKKITKYDKKTDAVIQAGAALGTSNNISVSDDLLYVLFRQSGVDFVAKNGQPVFNRVPGGFGGGESPAMSVVNFYTDFANPTRDTYTWNESMDNAIDAFVNGQVGFFFGYNYYSPIIKARAPELNVGVLPLLQLNPEQPVNVANYWVQAVTAKSKHQALAWNLIDFLTHSAATKQYLDATGRPSALRAYISGQNDNPELSPFVSQSLISDTWYHGNDYDAASKAIKDMIHEWLQSPPEPDKIDEWRQSILNRAADKVQQTL